MIGFNRVAREAATGLVCAAFAVLAVAGCDNDEDKASPEDAVLTQDSGVGLDTVACDCPDASSEPLPCPEPEICPEPEECRQLERCPERERCPEAEECECNCPDEPSFEGPPALSAELEYIKDVAALAPVASGDLTAIAVTLFNASNRTVEGIDWLTGYLDETTSALSPLVHAQIRAEIGALEATAAARSSGGEQLGFVNSAISHLEGAVADQPDDFLVRWFAGTVLAQVPSFLGKTDEALESLQWCLDHASSAPNTGWLREVYFRLALLAAEEGDEALAAEYLSESGYESLDETVVFTAGLTVAPATGGSMWPMDVRERISGRLYQVSGYDFAEFYFMTSANGAELIAIDMGTRPDSAQAAFEALIAEFPNLPPVTTVLVTHAHWDHVGGYPYFVEAFEDLTLIARDNYADELEIVGFADVPYTYFFGELFDIEDALAFVPDITVSSVQSFTIGGTVVDAIPVNGGETEDALVFYFPEESAVFTGDMIMPYLGAPFSEEGDPAELLEAIAVIGELDPALVLHGHEPINGFAPNGAALAGLGQMLGWLADEVESRMSAGATRNALFRANLIAPQLAQIPQLAVSYMVIREGFVDRLYDKNRGYWGPALEGLDHLDEEDFGLFLTKYLGLDEDGLDTLADRLIAGGDHHLALRVSRWALQAYPEHSRMKQAKKAALDGLVAGYQSFDPFRFFIYMEQAGRVLPPMQGASLR